MRLWAIGEGPALPKWDTRNKHVCLAKYRTMLEGVFGATAARAHPDAAWLVRCDARERTLDVVLPILTDIAGEREVEVSPAPFSRPTQTSLYGDRTDKPGEIDLLVRPALTRSPRRSSVPAA